MPRTVTYSVFYRKDEDNRYLASVPALPGCQTFGETFVEVQERVREAIELYIEALLEAGEQIPEETEPLQGRISIPLPLSA